MTGRAAVRKADVLDRIARLRRINSERSSERTAEYADGYEDALCDLLDAFEGNCHRRLWIEEVPCA